MRSLSAITWTAVLPRAQAELLRHNVYFSDDSPQEFNELFAQRRLPTQPTVYVCAQDRESGGPPTDTERLLCLVNAPADGDAPEMSDASAVDACERHMLAQLARCGLVLPWSQAVVRRSTPQDFERRYPGSGGALYGRASHGWQASFTRAGPRAALPGLYLAGGGVHPGPGVPMAALLGILTGLLAFLPNIGAIVSGALIILVGIALGLWMIGNLYDTASPVRHKWSVRVLALVLSSAHLITCRQNKRRRCRTCNCATRTLLVASAPSG